jgi:hypothetical protein
MLIIDIPKQKVHNSPHYDTDVVILKGASDELINSLAALTIATPPKACCGAHKVGLGGRQERYSKTVPQSMLAEGNGQFSSVFQKISNALSGISCVAQKVAQATAPSPARSYRVSSTFQVNKAQRIMLQNNLAKLLSSDAAYVETLRGFVQSSTILNPNAHTVTTRNIQGALALYAHYSHDHGFGSGDGATALKSVVYLSPDTISRLASELHILSRTGRSTSTRYFVNKEFERLTIRVLQNYAKFNALLYKVDAMQNQIDSLGSL